MSRALDDTWGKHREVKQDTRVLQGVIGMCVGIRTVSFWPSESVG